MDFSFIDFTATRDHQELHRIRVGFRPFDLYQGHPHAITCYIIAFGDFVFAEPSPTTPTPSVPTRSSPMTATVPTSSAASAI
jgi:hypothetical protein